MLLRYNLSPDKGTYTHTHIRYWYYEHDRMKLLNKGHLEIGNSTLNRQGYTASFRANQMSLTSYLECSYLIYSNQLHNKHLVFSRRRNHQVKHSCTCT